MTRIIRFWWFISFYLKAKTIQSIHSPFVYDMIVNTLEDERYFYAFDAIEKERNRLLNDHRLLRDEEFGAGSAMRKASQEEVSHIAETALSSPDQGQFIFKVVNWFQPEKMIELGTSLGISALYMHEACKSAEFISVEGSESISDLAKNLFKRQQTQVQLIVSDFESVIKQIKKSDLHFDLIYLDGNHLYQETVEIVSQLAPHVNDPGIIMLDDIYWSKGMKKAWMELGALRDIQISIDLFSKGLLIKNSEIEQRQRFRIIKKKWKPWK